MHDNKYILDEFGEYMIFSSTIHHSTAQCASRRHSRADCVGAGFIAIGPDGVSCWGYSESLKIKSRGVSDAEVIARRLNLKVYKPPFVPFTEPVILPIPNRQYNDDRRFSH